jgi:tetratricopeptide (TPR) repeat protein
MPSKSKAVGPSPKKKLETDPALGLTLASKVDIGDLNFKTQRKAHLEIELGRAPYDKRFLCEFGYVLLALGEYEEAATNLEKAVELGGHAEELWDRLGQAHASAWLINNHVDVPTRKLDPETLVTDQQHVEKAMAAYTQCLKFPKYASDPNYLFGIAEAYLAFGDVKGAVDILGHVLYAFPEYQRLNEVAFVLGVQSSRLGKYGDAENFFRFCLDCIPPGCTEEDLLYRISRCKKHQSSFAEADALLEEVFRKKEMVNGPYNPFEVGYNGRTARHESWKEWAEDPRSWKAYASKYWEQGDYVTALDSFQECAAVLRAKRAAKFKNNRLDKKCDDIDLELGAILLSAAQCHRKLREREESERVLLEAYEMDSMNGQIRKTILAWCPEMSFEWGDRCQGCSFF